MCIGRSVGNTDGIAVSSVGYSVGYAVVGISVGYSVLGNVGLIETVGLRVDGTYVGLDGAIVGNIEG